MLEIMHQITINYGDLQTYRNLFIGNIKNQCVTAEVQQNLQYNYWYKII